MIRIFPVLILALIGLVGPVQRASAATDCNDDLKARKLAPLSPLFRLTIDRKALRFADSPLSGEPLTEGSEYLYVSGQISKDARDHGVDRYFLPIEDAQHAKETSWKWSEVADALAERALGTSRGLLLHVEGPRLTFLNAYGEIEVVATGYSMRSAYGTFVLPTGRSAADIVGKETTKNLFVTGEQVVPNLVGERIRFASVQYSGVSHGGGHLEANGSLSAFVDRKDIPNAFLPPKFGEEGIVLSQDASTLRVYSLSRHAVVELPLRTYTQDYNGLRPEPTAILRQGTSLFVPKNIWGRMRLLLGSSG